jgi:hypothetical protein
VLRSCAWLALCSTVTPWRLATGSVAARATGQGGVRAAGMGLLNGTASLWGRGRLVGLGGELAMVIYPL